MPIYDHQESVHDNLVRQKLASGFHRGTNEDDEPMGNGFLKQLMSRSGDVPFFLRESLAKLSDMTTLSRDDAPGIGAVQTPSGGVARGVGPVQLPVGAYSDRSTRTALAGQRDGDNTASLIKP